MAPGSSSCAGAVPLSERLVYWSISHPRASVVKRLTVTRLLGVPKPNPTAVRAPRFAVYLRISKDADGTQDATARQLKDCRTYAKLHRLKIVEVFEDVDLSAYRRGVVRPAYEAMLEGLRSGQFDGVLVWRLDRLVRRTVEFSRFWTICEEAGAELRSVTQSIDTTDPVGRLVVSILVAFAEMESATTSARLVAKEDHMAHEGRHKSTGRKVYGLSADWSKLDRAEAKVIRQTADRLLAGESPSSIANDLNSRGVPSPRQAEMDAQLSAARRDSEAAQSDDERRAARVRLERLEERMAKLAAKPGGLSWNRAGVVALMRQPRLFGKREHHGEIVADGTWPQILDEATGLRVRQLLTSRRGTGHDGRRRYLLSGILRCEKCGARMKAQHSASMPGRYVCPPKSEGGCGSTTILREPTDAAVTEMVMAALDSPALATELRARKVKPTNDAELLAELSAIGERTDELGQMYAAGELTRSAFSAASRELEQRGEVLAGELATSRQAIPLAAIGEKGITRAWATMSLDRQRAVVEAVVDRIVVHGNGSEWYRERLAEKLLEEAAEYRTAGDERAARRRERQAAERTGGGGSFRPERLEVIWRV